MKLLRVKEAADLIGVNPASVRRLERRGVIPSIRDWAGHRRFKEAEVLKFKTSLLSGENAQQEK